MHVRPSHLIVLKWASGKASWAALASNKLLPRPLISWIHQLLPSFWASFNIFFFFNFFFNADSQLFWQIDCQWFLATFKLLQKKWVNSLMDQFHWIVQQLVADSLIDQIFSECETTCCRFLQTRSNLLLVRLAATAEFRPVAEFCKQTSKLLLIF